MEVFIIQVETEGIPLGLNGLNAPVHVAIMGRGTEREPVPIQHLKVSVKLASVVQLQGKGMLKKQSFVTELGAQVLISLDINDHE